MTGIQLIVSDKIDQLKGSTEAAFERRFAIYLDDMGIMSRHNSDRYEIGIPDRYVVGGNWIEFKVMDISGKRKVKPLRLFETEQKNKLTEYHEAGDRSWVAIQFQGKIDPIVLFLPWYRFKDHGPWSFDQLKEAGWPAGHLRTKLYEKFGPDLSRFSDGWFYDQEAPAV